MKRPRRNLPAAEPPGGDNAEVPLRFGARAFRAGGGAALPRRPPSGWRPQRGEALCPLDSVKGPLHFAAGFFMSRTPPLDTRAAELLKLLIERYIHDGQPIGSRTL